jgi:hypothetical protein
MLGSLIGGALKLGGSIFGGISASKAMKKVQKNLENQQRENQDWYDRMYNEDATQRADAQRILAITEQNIRNRNRQAAGTAAVMGGTDESVAATKAANASAMADAASQIAIAGDRRKDNIEQQYQTTKASINEKLNELEKQRAGMVSQAVQGASNAAGSIAGGIF